MSISARSITIYLAAVRSYLDFNDVEIVTRRFKRMVKVPKVYREDEEAIDTSDIREILLSCNNRRLKPYLLVLASAGQCAREATAIRLCDIDFSINPTKIHVRKEYSKTRTARDIYISDEATKFLKDWIAWKYRSNSRTQIPADLVFTNRTNVRTIGGLYNKIRLERVQ